MKTYCKSAADLSDLVDDRRLKTTEINKTCWHARSRKQSVWFFILQNPVDLLSSDLIWSYITVNDYKLNLSAWAEGLGWTLKTDQD